jgi:hypothetical protein
MLQNAKALRFSPVGLSDALAEEDAFPGACASLQNLIPDPTTKNLWTPRPAAVQFATLAGGSASGGVSVFKVVGSFIYGLYAFTGGNDIPFCYNLATSAFVAVTGATGSNVPATQPTTGDWTPPTMDVMGPLLVVTHPGFDGVTNFIGWFDITTPSAPVWYAGNFSLVTPILTSVLVVAGSGYANGTYPNVPLIGGTGAGATANITVSGGSVTAYTITNTGVGYQPGDDLTVSNSSLGGTGSGLIIQVTAVAGSGIFDLTLLVTGSGYTNGTYNNVALTDYTGSGATANIVVVGGSVVGVTIVNPGQGYTVNDIVTVGGGLLTFGTITGGSGYTNGYYSNIALQGGTGLGATANFTVSGGAVTALSVVSPGGAYKTTDTLTVSTGGGITAFNITNPGNGGGGDINGTFPGVQQLGTSGHGTGAVFTFVITSGYLTAAACTNPGSGYAANDTLTFKYATTIQATAVSAAGPLGNGSLFAVKVGTVSANPLGSPTVYFQAQVLTLTNPGGYINFTTVPSWVRQFNGRSWFGVNPPTGTPSVIFSDPYSLNCTNANQALSFGDNTPLTCAAPLGLANLLGGVIQSLIVFKSLNGIIQITGDASTNNLSVNQVPGGSGTLSARSLAEHPQGLLYLDHDGYRMVTLDGNCTDPIGVAGQGVVVPFLNCNTPTRVCAACNGSILRVSVNSVALGWVAYWFDLVRKVWSGPHTDPATVIDVYEDTFITSAQAVPNGLFETSPIPYAGESFTEFGSQLTWVYQTVVLMDNQQMAQSEIAEMQVKANAVTGMSGFTVAAIENGTTINSTTFNFASTGAIQAQRIDFNAPVVYNRLALKMTGSSYAGFQIGDIFVRARVLGYQAALPHP